MWAMIRLIIFSFSFSFFIFFFSFFFRLQLSHNYIFFFLLIMHHIQVAKLFLFTFKRGFRIISIPVWLLSNIVSGALPIVVFILSLLYTLPRGISFNTNYPLERYISKVSCMAKYRTKSVLFNVIQINKIKFYHQILHYQLREIIKYRIFHENNVNLK